MYDFLSNLLAIQVAKVGPTILIVYHLQPNLLFLFWLKTLEPVGTSSSPLSFWVKFFKSLKNYLMFPFYVPTHCHLFLAWAYK